MRRTQYQAGTRRKINIELDIMLITAADELAQEDSSTRTAVLTRLLSGDDLLHRRMKAKIRTLNTTAKSVAYA